MGLPVQSILNELVSCDEYITVLDVHGGKLGNFYRRGFCIHIVHILIQTHIHIHSILVIYYVKYIVCNMDRSIKVHSISISCS